MSDEKVALLRAYGAEVVVCPTAVPPEDPRSYYSTAERLVRETPGAFRPDQYSNPANPLAHEQTTGPEIWRQTDGRITHFVAGIGTGGTITGVGALPEGAEPRRADRRRRPVGLGVLGRHRPAVSRRRRRRGLLADDLRPVARRPRRSRSATPTRSSPRAASRSEEGLLIGGSGGTAVHAALEVARALGPDAVVVVLLPDSGRSYLSKIFDDQWMFDMGFLRGRGPGRRRRARGEGRRDCPTLVLDHARRAGARRDHADARDRRVAARRERHEGAAARGQGGRRARCASSS